MEVYRQLAENINGLPKELFNLLSAKTIIIAEEVKETLASVRDRNWGIGLAVKTASSFFPIEHVVVKAQSEDKTHNE